MWLCQGVGMKQFIWYLLFAAMVFVSYQGYVNSRDDPETEALAREAVCAVDKACGIAPQELAVVRVTDILSRKYQWNLKSGSHVATCKREYMFLGHWKCEAQSGPDRPLSRGRGSPSAGRRGGSPNSRVAGRRTRGSRVADRRARGESTVAASSSEPLSWPGCRRSGR
jgi:hypothetical protein